MLGIVWQMTKVNLLAMLRDRRAMLFLILMPVLLMSILSFALADAFGGQGIAKFRVGVYDGDGGTVARSLVQVLSTQSRYFSVTPESNAAAGRNAVSANKIDVLVVIPAGLTASIEAGSPLPVSVDAAMNHDTEQSVVESVINAFGKQAGIQTYELGQLGKPQAVTVKTTVDTHSSGLHPLTAGSYYAIGMMAMFVLMRSLNLAGTMVRARNSDQYRRLLAAPASRLALLLGHFLSSFAALLVQAILLLGLAKYLLQANLGPWDQVLLITVGYSLALAGVTVVFGTFVKSPGMMDGIGNIGANVLALLGGSFFPLAGFPAFFQFLSRLLPNGLALNSLVDSVSGIATASLVAPVLELAGMGILLALVSSLHYGKAA